MSPHYRKEESPERRQELVAEPDPALAEETRPEPHGAARSDEEVLEPRGCIR
ncbi:MAG: hypothetical protein OXQ90_21260 [Gammaproteobacteria bacterium]|nr:hypothetical protein [Gammaproteobacteria bacterium]